MHEVSLVKGQGIDRPFLTTLSSDSRWERVDGEGGVC